MISKIEKQIAGISKWENTPSGHEYNVRPNWFDLGFDHNSLPFTKDTLIIVTSWWGHLHFMEATLTKYRETGAFVLLAYDFPFKGWDPQVDLSSKLPPQKVFLLPHSFLMKHVTFDNDKRNGWLWLMWYAYGFFRSFWNFDYVITVNSDCIWEKPNGIDQLKEELGDDDLMSVSSEPNNIHTCAVIYKRKAFQKIMSHIKKHLNVPILGSWSPETLLTEAVREFKLKEKIVPKQPMEPDGRSVDHYSRYNQSSTWKDIVGYRNLGAEFLTILIERMNPVPRKYIDLELMEVAAPGFSAKLSEYYKTGDRRWLYMAWDHNETSWYDRLYMPIEYYGEKPIYTIDPENKFELTRTAV